MASEPEPVAWRYREVGLKLWNHDAKPIPSDASGQWEREPLYTAAALLAAEQRGRESAAQVVDDFRPDASFDDSSAGYVERDALLKNIAAAIRKGDAM